MKSTNTESKLARKRLQNSFAGNAWFQLPQEFLRALPHNQAILMAYLINIAYVVRAEDRNDGWFYCEAKRIAAEINIGERFQSKMISDLRTAGLLLVERRGSGARRFMRIQYGKLRKLIEALPPIDTRPDADF